MASHKIQFETRVSAEHPELHRGRGVVADKAGWRCVTARGIVEGPWRRSAVRSFSKIQTSANMDDPAAEQRASSPLPGLRMSRYHE